MTSLREASHGRPVDHVALLDGFLSRLEVRIEALRGGRFDVADWTDRQLTTGRDVVLIDSSGAEATVRAVGVDGASGALVVADGSAPSGERSVVVGEIRHVRLAAPTPAPDAVGV
jgi:biotin-(acetyl-CoA carboxylase) ligase